jgi:Tol biopolymer transport system component
MRSRYLALILIMGGAAGLLSCSDSTAPLGDPRLVIAASFAPENFIPSLRIWVMTADGKNRKQLDNLPGPGFDYPPSWSPDGRRIAFVKDTSIRDLPNTLVVLTADGKPLLQLSQPGTHFGDPEWSPDGSELVVAFSQNVSAGGQSGLARMSATGANFTPIPGTEGAGHPSWSPDGAQLVFQCGGGGGICSIPIAGGTRHVLAGGVDPEWSPDGRRIAFETDNDVEVMDADGANAHIIVTQPDSLGLQSRKLAWSPDGGSLLFSADGPPGPNSGFDMYIVPSAGGASRRLTDLGGQFIFGVDWSRAK